MACREAFVAAGLGEAEFARVWRSGLAMGAVAAAAYALGGCDFPDPGSHAATAQPA